MTYGLLGEKLSHSYSPEIHKELGDYDYRLYNVAPEELESFLLTGDFQGLNVTIPYKKAVIPFCAELSPLARKIGSVNTIIRREDGTLFGDNTDYFGFAYMAEKAGISFADKKILVLGSGGTFLTAKAVMEDADAREIVLVSRTGEVNYSNLNLHTDADIIVNTTPIGMYPDNGEKLLTLSDFPKCSGVIDVIYNPMSTALILEAKKLNIPCTGGFPMLVAQAVKSAELFTGKDIPDYRTGEIIHKLANKVFNLILIGMPGAGKTSIGAEIAKILRKPFLDMDTIIAEEAGKSIPEIFATQGEGAFREMEKDLAAKIGKERGAVIATGGGSILNPLNQDALMQNGKIYFIERELSLLARDGRPLSKDLETLQKMYEERLPIYNACADAKMQNDKTIIDAAVKIAEDFCENIGD